MSDFTNLNSDVRLVPNGTRPVLFYASQYDVGRIFNVHVIDDGEDWEIPDGASAVLNAIKPDNNVYSADLSTTSSYVQIVTDEQLTAVAGRVLCEVRFTLSSGEDLGTANFYIAVEESPLEGGTVSESTIGAIQSALVTLAEYAGAAAESASAAATSESNAAESASAAAASATAAATSETNAAASESAAATSESNAAASESAAADSATAAAESEANALTYMETAQNNAASDLGFYWGSDGFLYCSIG